MVRKALLFLGAGFLFLAGPLPAHADLNLCNNTDSRVGVAIGYKKDKKEGWVTEGWWTVPPRAESPKNCLTLLKGNLISQFYYIFAVDYDKGGSWGGKSMMCTRDKVFTIVGRQDCENRGYTKTGFFEVDTGEEPDWTVSLSGEKTTQGQ
jgi:uncharacterized membrane protein